MLWSPLVYLFLRGVAKLKNLQAEVSYVLVCAVDAIIPALRHQDSGWMRMVFFGSGKGYVYLK